MKVDDGCVCFLKLDDNLNALLKQGDVQATKLEYSKAIATYLKAADFIKKKFNEHNNNNNLDDSNYFNSSANHSRDKHSVWISSTMNTKHGSISAK